RMESYEQERKDRQRAPGQGNLASSDNTEFLPGLGFTYELQPTLQLFGSVYKAFSPALNGDALNGLEDQQLDAERSVNFEVGLRGGTERVTYQVTAFRMDFDNQIIPANSNSQFQVTNGGKTSHQGLEAGMGVELGGGFSVDANFTYLPDAEFEGERFNRDGVLTTPGGNRIPYTPEWVTNLGLIYANAGFR